MQDTFENELTNIFNVLIFGASFRKNKKNDDNVPDCLKMYCVYIQMNGLKLYYCYYYEYFHIL